jgi:hypothetical protein
MSILMKINEPEPKNEPIIEQSIENKEEDIFNIEIEEKPIEEKPIEEKPIEEKPIEEKPIKKPKKPRSQKQIEHLRKMRERKMALSLERNADKIEQKRIRDAKKEEKRQQKEQEKQMREEKLQEKTIEVLEKRNQQSSVKKEKPVNSHQNDFESFMNNYAKMKQMEQFFLEKNKKKEEPVKKEPVKKESIKKPQLQPQDFAFGLSYKKNNRRRYF